MDTDSVNAPPPPKLSFPSPPPLELIPKEENNESVTNMETDEEDKVYVRKGELRLGLRHRDSFAVHNHHLHPEDHSDNGKPKKSKAAEILELLTGKSTNDAEIDNVDLAAVLNDDDDVGSDDAKSEILSDGSPDEYVVDLEIGNTLDNLASLSLAVNDSSESSEENIRKKNKLKSMVKGVGSFLGLRKSKKKRLAEAAAAAKAAEVEGMDDESTPTVSTPTESNSIPIASTDPVEVDSSRSTNSTTNILGSPQSKMTSSTSPPPFNLIPPPPPPTTLDTPATPIHVDLLEPLRDEDGLFMPGHTRELLTRSIIRERTRRRNSNLASSSTIPASPMLGHGRRKLTFADQHGKMLNVVYECPNLHYSEGAEHDYEDGRCVVM